MESPKALLENENKIACPQRGVPPNADRPGVSTLHPVSGWGAPLLRFENVQRGHRLSNNQFCSDGPAQLSIQQTWGDEELELRNQQTWVRLQTRREFGRAFQCLSLSFICAAGLMSPAPEWWCLNGVTVP